MNSEKELLTLEEALKNIPEAGYLDKDGNYVLPSDWYNPEDDNI